MAVDIHKLIAAINPDVYCKPEFKDEVKKLAKEKGYLEASQKAEVREAEFVDMDKMELDDPMRKPGFKFPIEKHTLDYEAGDALLEQVYFWIHDFISAKYRKGIDKVVDNFIASPGSSYYSEWAAKAQQAQQQATSILANVNQVIRVILNLIYDLRDFKLRLDVYDRYNSKDENEKNAALISLKQIWLDQVDIKRGNTSIKALALSGGGPGQVGPNFVTLLDAFMYANSLKQIDDMDLNELVKKVLKQRVPEFYDWIKESEVELRKRYSLEKTYLKSEVNAVKLYARWLKPYLKAAKSAEQRATETSALLTAFNTVLFELAIIGKSDYNIDEMIAKEKLPAFFKGKVKRNYLPIILVELKFRSVLEKLVGQHKYTGKVNVVFTSYCLNEDEIKILKEQIEKDDSEDAMKLIEGVTSESLETVKSDIDEFLEEKPATKKEENKSNDTNPFSALFSSFGDLFKKKEKPAAKKEESKPLVPDNDIEKVIRSQAIIESRKKCDEVYNTYKKAHSMFTF